MTTLTLTPGAVTLDDLAQVYWHEAAVRLDHSCHPAIELAHARIARAAAGSDAVYGVNTGFGKLASVKIASQDTATLQRNLILSHCCGVGPAIPRRHARLLMALKLLSLGRGASGVRLEVVELLFGAEVSVRFALADQEPVLDTPDVFHLDVRLDEEVSPAVEILAVEELACLGRLVGRQTDACHRAEEGKYQ